MLTTTTMRSEELQTPTRTVCLATLHCSKYYGCLAAGLHVFFHSAFTDYKKYSVNFIQMLK